uniref:C-type lectin domain-containing protein n=1 Tax=Strongyloides stercoralis TaxID=6248 RepID=A0A0K0EHA3_STRER
MSKNVRRRGVKRQCVNDEEDSVIQVESTPTTNELLATIQELTRRVSVLEEKVHLMEQSTNQRSHVVKLFDVDTTLLENKRASLEIDENLRNFLDENFKPKNLKELLSNPGKFCRCVIHLMMPLEAIQNFKFSSKEVRNSIRQAMPEEICRKINMALQYCGMCCIEDDKKEDYNADVISAYDLFSSNLKHGKSKPKKIPTFLKNEDFILNNEDNTNN